MLKDAFAFFQEGRKKRYYSLLQKFVLLNFSSFKDGIMVG